MGGAALTNLKVALDFVLEETRVLLQGLSKLKDAVADLQKVHRVAIVVP